MINEKITVTTDWGIEYLVDRSQFFDESMEAVWGNRMLSGESIETFAGISKKRIVGWQEIE